MPPFSVIGSKRSFLLRRWAMFRAGFLAAWLVSGMFPPAFAHEGGTSHVTGFGGPSSDPRNLRASSTAASVASEDLFETYRQEVLVTFDSEAAASQATFAITPLWDGCEWAVSSRWDDLNPNSLRMREVLAEHGHRGTFYLNAGFSEWSSLTTTQLTALGRSLIVGGFSLASHSLSHPWLSHCHRNRIFEELAGSRMVLEAAADTPVLSFAFPYLNFRNEDEGDVIHADVVRLLQRAGYYHVANESGFEALSSDLVLSPILPPDGAPIVAAAEAALADPNYRSEHPILTYSMHAWYQTPEQWRAFAADLDRYGNHPNWWYCHQNAYAAYRRQFRQTHLEVQPATGRIRRLLLDRPRLLDLNDPIPLTLEVQGVASTSSLTAVECRTAETRRSDRVPGALRFHVDHDRDQGLPTVIGMVPPNTTNHMSPENGDQDTDLPGLRAVLFYRAGRLHLLLENNTGETVRDGRITYRLPLRFTDGVTRRTLPDVAAGGVVSDAWAPRTAAENYKLTAGDALLIAQLDFRLGDRHCRLYASCQLSNRQLDPAYPQAAFVRLGPLPMIQVEVAQLSAALRSGEAGPRPWQLDDGSIQNWQVAADPFAPPHLDVERLRLHGEWHDERRTLGYVLMTEAVSVDARSAKLRADPALVYASVFNGQSVDASGLVSLRAGTNSLAILVGSYPDLFVRIADPATGAGLPGLSYQAPALAPLTALPFAVPVAPDTEPLDIWLTRQNDGSFLLEWGASAVLEGAPSLLGPWQEIPTVRRRHLGHAVPGQRFFRLRGKHPSAASVHAASDADFRAVRSTR